MQRIDEHARRHAARAGGGERRFDGLADLVVERHVDLEAERPAAVRDGVEQPGARLRVVELDLDAVAADGGGA